jgi:small subunit ribosomal protein S6
LNLTAKSDDIIELDRQLKLSEAVLRTKVLRADEAVFRINPVEVPAETAAEKAAEKAEEAPAKKPAAKTTKPAAKTAK